MIKQQRVYQVHMVHENGDERIHAWFTYDDAMKHVDKESKIAKRNKNKITNFEIIKDHTN